MGSYKTEKEDFVSGHSGSSVTHINAVSSVALASVALYLALQTRIAFPSRLSSSGPRGLLQLTAEFTLLVLPLLLSVTLFAEYPLTLSFSLLIPAFLVYYVLPPLPPPPPPALLPPPSPSSSRPSTPTNLSHSSIHVLPSPTPTPRRTTFGSSNAMSMPVPPLPALTTYRAHMMLMTILCILAVDFPVFPRNMSKCESWGVSVMDLGVGSFVFSQGVVSAIPIIKNPGILRGAVMPKVLSAARKVIPLFVLGLVRVLAVKGTEYPEHVTEYGVHWNFFITLALLPPVSILFYPLIARVPLSLLGLVVTLTHQIILNNTSLQSWALGTDRSTLLDQNKEGIVSFVEGYLALHLFGLAIGTLILPPSPSHFRRAVSGLNNISTSRAPSPSPSRLQVDNDLHTGRRLLTPDPDSSEDDEPAPRPTPVREEPRKRGKAAIELCSYAVVWWTLFWIGAAAGGGTDAVSRRLANTLYVLWVAAFNTSFLLGYVLLDSLFARPQTTARSSGFPAAKERLSVSSPKSKSFGGPSFKVALGNDPIRERVGSSESDGSKLLSAINLNGLLLFLVANIATGLVNMSMRTMYAADRDAILVLVMYAYVFSLCAWLLQGRRVVTIG